MIRLQLLCSVRNDGRLARILEHGQEHEHEHEATAFPDDGILGGSSGVAEA
jgi:hypothetical protein